MSFLGNGVGRTQVVAGQIGPGAVTYPTLDTSVTAPMMMFRNKIINGNFDIWQRGTSLAADTTYRFISDRWATEGVGSTLAPAQQTFTLGQTDVPCEPRFFHRAVVASSAGSGNFARLTHRIEGVRTLAGQQAMLSFWAKADTAKNVAVETAQAFGTGGSPSATVTGISVSTRQLSTSWQLFKVPITLPSIAGKQLGTSGDDFVQVAFWFDAGSNYNTRTNSLGQQSGTFDIAQVQLEIGTNATAFEQRPVGVELALCQRYYQTGQHRINTQPNGNYIGGTVFLARSMRATPSVTFTDVAGNANKYTLDGLGDNQNTVTGGNVIFGTTPTSMDMDFLYTPQNRNWMRFYWQASAEL